MDTAARIKTPDFRNVTNLSFKKTTDPETSGGSLQGLRGGTIVSATKTQKDTTYRILGSLTIVDASVSELLDSERTKVDTARVTTTALASVQHRINATNVLSWTNSVQMVDFTNPVERLTHAGVAGPACVSVSSARVRRSGPLYKYRSGNAVPEFRASSLN